MTERFELRINDNGQVDIIDWLESRQKDAICIYNDLGVLPYSSAKAVCELLNNLHEENHQLKFDKTNLHRTMSRNNVKYNQFKDKLFSCLDNRIKLFKDCCMTNEAKIIEELKEELQE